MTRRTRRVSRRRRRAVLLTVAAVVVALVVAAGWVVVRGLMARAELEAAMATSSDITAALETGDFESASTGVDALVAHSGEAAALTSDPVWRAAEVVPTIGPNLTAVRVASAQAHAVSADAVQPLLALAASLSAGDADGSLVDLDALVAGAPAINGAADALTTAKAALADLDTEALLPPLREGVENLEEVVSAAGDAVAVAQDSAVVVPEILGRDAPQTILVMLQNNAELRTGGGITGTFIEVLADDGRLRIVEQADSSDFDVRDSDITALPDSLDLLYGDDVAGRHVQNTSLTADFDLTARMASAWWAEHSGRTPDAVVSVDPLVLQSILAATGPVQTSQGDVTAENLVQRLLVDPYRTLSQDAQSAVFQDAATAVFDRLTGGDLGTVALVSALADPAAEGRIAVWSADAATQDVLSGTTLGGPAARQRLAGDDAFAVYLSDATGGKMDTLLDTAIGIGAVDCDMDGHQDVVVSVTLSNTAPTDAGSAFPVSMTGGGAYGVRPGDIGTVVVVSAPVGTFYGGVTVDGETVAPVDVTEAGFPVSGTQILLKPGQARTMEFRFRSAGTGDVSPTLLHTPLVYAPTVAALSPACG